MHRRTQHAKDDSKQKMIESRGRDGDTHGVTRHELTVELTVTV